MLTQQLLNIQKQSIIKQFKFLHREVVSLFTNF